MMNQNLLANRYRIIQKLGSGGFGDTFLAEDTHLPSGRTCVIKQLRPMNNNPQVYQLVKERFQREAAILEDLGNSHGQIPTLFAYFEEQGEFYLVQEYIQGETLSRLLENQGKQSETFVKETLLNLLVVLEYIQSKRVIHRDLKPDNIIIRQADGMPILIDFGAVRETMGTVMSSSGNSTSSIVIGTPGFMPPEQSIGRPVFSSDLYALGLTAIYLLTGRIPQELETEPLTGEILWRQYALNVSPTLANIIDQSIKSQANQRFATAQLMRQALQGQPIISPTQPSFPSPQQPIILPTQPLVSPESKTPISDWLKITFAAGIMGITFLAGWAFLSREQQRQLEQGISKIQSANPTSESKNNQEEKQNQAEKQQLAEKERQLAEKQRQLEQTQKELAEKLQQRPGSNSPSITQQPSIVSSYPSITKPSPKQVILDYYEAINQGEYRQAWNMLPVDLQENKKVHPKGYNSFENWVQQIRPMTGINAQVVEQLSEQASVNLRYRCFLNGKPLSMTLRYKLFWNEPQQQWMIQSVKKIN